MTPSAPAQLSQNLGRRMGASGQSSLETQLGMWGLQTGEMVQCLQEPQVSFSIKSGWPLSHKLHKMSCFMLVTLQMHLFLSCLCSND